MARRRIVFDDVAVPELSTWLQDQQVMTELIRQHLARAKERMKRQADKNRSESQFKVGDMVFVKIQPYVQSTLAAHANQKLSFKFYGPFQIIAKIGSVAYKLHLPPSTSIHPVFHVSQLKAAITSGTHVSPSLPTDIELPRIPLEVLQRPSAPTATGSAKQGLILWSGWPHDMATWENLHHLRQAFPRAPSWGQAGLQDPRTVKGSSTPATTDEEVHGPRAGSRIRKPNTRLAGSEWV